MTQCSTRYDNPKQTWCGRRADVRPDDDDCDDDDTNECDECGSARERHRLALRTVAP